MFGRLDWGVACRIRRLIINMATDNPTWGYRHIHGELTRLGHQTGASTIWRILEQHNIDSAPQRSEVTWSQFLRSQAAVGCDFATAMLRRSEPKL
jgi:putative transposase